MLVIISFLKNPTGNNAIYSYFPKTDIFKVLGCKSIDKYIQLLVLFPSGSYAFSYTINKLSCLSVLLKNIRNISRHFPFSQFISLFLVQWKKANRSRQKWQRPWGSNLMARGSNTTDRWILRRAVEHCEARVKTERRNTRQG